MLPMPTKIIIKTFQMIGKRHADDDMFSIFVNFVFKMRLQTRNKYSNDVKAPKNIGSDGAARKKGSKRCFFRLYSLKFSCSLFIIYGINVEKCVPFAEVSFTIHLNVNSGKEQLLNK